MLRTSPASLGATSVTLLRMGPTRDTARDPWGRRDRRATDGTPRRPEQYGEPVRPHPSRTQTERRAGGCACTRWATTPSWSPVVLAGLWLVSLGGHWWYAPGCGSVRPCVQLEPAVSSHH